MKTILLLTIFIFCSFFSFSQISVNTQTGNVGVGVTNPSSKLDVNGTTQTSQLLVTSPNVTTNWNTLWQSGFYDSDNAVNAPEPGTWFWGINMGHRYNRSDYRYGGQIAIRFGSVNPVMYFRSSDTGNGWGTWARVLTNTGTQQINGDIHLPVSRNIWIGNVGDQGNRLRLHHNNQFAYIDFSPDLIFRGGNNLVETMRLTSNGNVGIGKAPASNARLDIAGSAFADGVRLTSDERLKTNVQALNVDKISRLYRLQAKSYQKTLRSTRMDAMSDTITTLSAEQQRTVEFSEFGFLAQELKGLFPELVEQASDGYYMINYIGLIPVIVEALKEQRQELERQRAEIEQLRNPGGGISIRTNTVSSVDEPLAFEAFVGTEKPAALHQNVPNPFKQATQIRYYLPKTVSTASLCIYDLNGKQLKQIPLTQRGEGSEIIQGSQFAPGIYLYALIADGREIDVKRMILTE